MTNRVETGNLKINDDWTGVFIRGDNALMYYAPPVLKLIQGLELNLFDRNALTSLYGLLSGCDEGNETQRISGEVII